LNAILAFTASKHCNSQTAIKAMELMNMLYTSASSFTQADSSGFGNEAESKFLISLILIETQLEDNYSMDWLLVTRFTRILLSLS